MITLRTKMGRRLTVTADHPMVVQATDGASVVLAGELTDEHWLPISLGAPVPGDGGPASPIADEPWDASDESKLEWLRAAGADQLTARQADVACRLWAELGTVAELSDHSSGWSVEPHVVGEFEVDRKGTAWVRVVSVDRRAASCTVYSVEVARNHTVVTTGGLVAHNCFPKDSRALLKIANEAGYRFDLLAGVITVNDEQFDRVTDKIRVAAGGDLQGRIVAVWGLTFKARTDDLRDSPSISIINRLLAAGASVQGYDPTVISAKPGVPDGVQVCADAYAATAGADVLAVLTEWDDFRWLEPSKVADVMTGRTVVDGRNLLDRADWTRAGFTHLGIGR